MGGSDRDFWGEVIVDKSTNQQLRTLSAHGVVMRSYEQRKKRAWGEVVAQKRRNINYLRTGAIRGAPHRSKRREMGVGLHRSHSPAVSSSIRAAGY